MQSAVRELLPEHRVQVCYRHRVPGDPEGVRVYRRQKGSSTYYRGLMVCGSVWACPVCAAKISERRRMELSGAVDLWRNTRGTVLMLTLTVPHTFGSKSFELLDNLLGAYRSFTSGKYRLSNLVPGYAGAVRALEVTHGQNGWHPHLHVIVFTENQEVPLTDIEARLRDRWARVVMRHKLGQINVHGLRLDDGSKAARYASKWGMAEELTKAHVKEGRQGGRTPWALIKDYMQGDTQAGALFREFVQVFKGRSQLQWSRGLRQVLGMGEEKTDEEVALETVEADDLLMARIDQADWRTIRRYHLRGQVLELLREAEWSAVQLLLDEYRERHAAD